MSLSIFGGRTPLLRIAALLLLSTVLLLCSIANAAAQDVQPAAIQTNVTSNITSDTTWTLANSPYDVLNDISVVEDVTLTIEPGVTVRFANHARLDVRGTLLASGTADNRITFTGSTAQKGWWENLAIQGTSIEPNTGSVLDYVTLEYGGETLAGLYLYEATVQVSNTIIRNNAMHGISGGNRASANLANVAFENNGTLVTHYAVYYADGSVNPTFANVTATGNTNDVIAIGAGTLSGAHIWEAAGLPYVIAGDIQVAAAASLVVQPGVEVRMAQHAAIDARGALTAVGTAEQPILFTGTTQQPGWWENISISGLSSAQNLGSALEHVTIEYGGEAYANLYLYEAVVPVRHAIIRHSGNDGIQGGNRGVAHVSDTTFTANGASAERYPIRFSDGQVNPVFANLTATGNGVNAIALGAGELSGEHIWENVGLPYVLLGDMRVANGASLTIQPGLQVRLAQHAGIDARGTLTAVGTQAAPILFTGTTQQPGWWENITVQGVSGSQNTTSRLEYVTLEYGGEAYANLYLYEADLTVRNATIRHSGSNGMSGGNRGQAHIGYTTFANNAGYAVHFADGAVNPQLAAITATDNGNDSVAIGGGTLVGEHVWEEIGTPYTILGDIRVDAGSELHIDPNVTLAFAQHAALDVRGRLIAVGLESSPIRFTGTSATRGWWEGILIQGVAGTPNVGSMIKHAVVEYGGSSYANIYLYEASAEISRVVVRESGKDGVFVSTGAEGTVIDASQIVNNAAFGLRNATENDAIRASANWWGAATGPQVAQNCNVGGTGSVITPNVDFRPFLTESDGEVSTVAPASGYLLSLAPQRWYLPADGVTRADVLITVRNGEGQPVLGRIVKMHTTRGFVIDGGMTNAHGQTLARIASNNPGIATLTASVSETDPCANIFHSGTATVNFTPFDPGELTPGAAAPYMDGGLGFFPDPIVEGVPTKITARLTNPNDFPILVNGTFGIAQSGIGLAFPPVGSVEGFEIPANSTRVVTIDWVPPISGHYCIRFDYNWTTKPDGVQAAEMLGAGGTQRNLNVFGGTPNGYDDKKILNQASKYGTYIGGAGNGTGEGFIPGVGVTILTEWQLTMGARISRAMGGDPPRQDYTLIAEAEPVLLPAVPVGNGVTQAMATALNDLRLNVAWANAYGAASLIDFDRYGGATAANQLMWASQQINAMSEHKMKMAEYLLKAADAMDAYRAARSAAGIPDLVVTGEDLAAYQARLQATGFTQEEIDAAHAVGMTDAEIAETLQQHLAADPDEISGSLSDVLVEMAAAYRAMGNNILWPPIFGLGSVGGSGLLAAGAGSPPTVPASNNLARVFDHASTIEIANPTSGEATIDLRVLPIDLPSGWMATVSPAQVTLAAGAQTTVEVRITPAGPSVQGTTPRVAIEGYIGDELLGGVTVDIVVPYNVAKPAAHLMTFLPVVGQ